MSVLLTESTATTQQAQVPEFEVCGTKGKMRTINNGMVCQFRKASDSSRLLEEMPFPEVPRESGTEMGIKNLAEALDTGEEHRDRFNSHAAAKRC